MIIDRLIRIYNAESWSRVIAKPWNEIPAEVTSWSAASASLPSSARPSDIPLPVSLVIIDLPDSDRPVASSSAFDILSPGGIMIVPEPEVPTGDVGFPVAGEEPTEAQSKVIAFNQWISFIKDVSANHSVSFVELSGGTLAIIRRVS